ncbi:hypothetical protein CYMTET_32734 [Cymbomonas tetramitiformis]|uniref:Nardilysin-like n=1 Tax=Cymbomonas tetramitiformis TaxID=36881 RepID=A0AAE0KRX1_9CHLO|nr:hypothetical protein CYMTET_32734 [Cymbomonas tetramitiformis]
MASAMAVEGEATIIKSEEDRKLYRRVTLGNGLSALLIHDPDMLTMPNDKVDGEGGTEEDEEDEDSDEEDKHASEEDDDEEDDDDGEEDEEGEDGNGGNKKEDKAPTKRAAAAMAVGIGSFSDPLEIQGLSHFLEHMLFMGSKKYPCENEYDKFLTDHGGMSNAFTEAEYTCYHFDVQPASLHDALDRFAQFFISPLVLEGALEREVQAVHSEFKQVQQSDSARLQQLQCYTARPGHPFSKFSWGNEKSLVELPASKGIDQRTQLLQYYKEHYLAGNMTLVVLGLRWWVTEIFSEVRSGGERREFAASGSPFPAGERVLYKSGAVKEHHELNITFPLPCLHTSYAKKAEDYYSHLIGHEGAGSLLSLLKARGLASKLSSGVSESGHDRSTACYLFNTNITLTDAGLEDTYGVLGLFFQYLEMLRSAGPQA